MNASCWSMSLKLCTHIQCVHSYAMDAIAPLSVHEQVKQQQGGGGKSRAQADAALLAEVDRLMGGKSTKGRFWLVYEAVLCLIGLAAVSGTGGA